MILVQQCGQGPGLGNQADPEVVSDLVEGGRQIALGDGIPDSCAGHSIRF